MAKIKLIVGLGNPGQNYNHTRHNVGFDVLDSLVEKFRVYFTLEKKFLAEIAKIQFNGKEIILIKPITFMNLSGQAVSAVANYFKIKPEEILVIHDELDLSPGRLKLKQGGGNGGHNGLKSIDAQLGSNRYFRLRVGIGHPRDLEDKPKVNLSVFGIILPSRDNRRKTEVSNYVLKKPSSQDQAKIAQATDKILSNIKPILEQDLEKAQRALHSL